MSPYIYIYIYIYIYMDGDMYTSEMGRLLAMLHYGRVNLKLHRQLLKAYGILLTAVVSNCRTCNILHLPWHSSHLALYVGIWMFLKLGWRFEHVGTIVRKPRYISFRTLFDDILIEDILTVTLRSNMLFPFTSLLSARCLAHCCDHRLQHQAHQLWHPKEAQMRVG